MSQNNLLVFIKKTNFRVLGSSLALICLLASSVYAGEFYAISKTHEITDHGLLDIKGLFQQDFPKAKLDNYELDSVELYAKSLNGNAHARIKIGDWQSDPQTIPGNSADYNNPHPRTWSRINFLNKASGLGKPWIVSVDGSSKVSIIVGLTMRNYLETVVPVIRCDGGERAFIIISRGKIAGQPTDEKRDMIVIDYIYRHPEPILSRLVLPWSPQDDGKEFNFRFENEPEFGHAYIKITRGAASYFDFLLNHSLNGLNGSFHVTLLNDVSRLRCDTYTPLPTYPTHPSEIWANWASPEECIRTGGYDDCLAYIGYHLADDKPGKTALVTVHDIDTPYLHEHVYSCSSGVSSSDDDGKPAWIQRNHRYVYRLYSVKSCQDRFDLLHPEATLTVMGK